MGISFNLPIIMLVCSEQACYGQVGGSGVSCTNFAGAGCNSGTTKWYNRNLTRMFQVFWVNGQLPQDLRDANIIHLYKITRVIAHNNNNNNNFI